ncbi:MAG: hypothetical protein QOG04_2200 [Actinomycetota bacterium]|nr:hypothetical protein [Actinomycetota bacterium]
MLSSSFSSRSETLLAISCNLAVGAQSAACVMIAALIASPGASGSTLGAGAELIAWSIHAASSSVAPAWIRSERVEASDEVPGEGEDNGVVVPVSPPQPEARTTATNETRTSAGLPPDVDIPQACHERLCRSIPMTRMTTGITINIPFESREGLS